MSRSKRKPYTAWCGNGRGTMSCWKKATNREYRHFFKQYVRNNFLLGKADEIQLPKYSIWINIYDSPQDGKKHLLSEPREDSWQREWWIKKTRK